MTSLELQTRSTFGEAAGYIKTLERSLERKSKFNNDLLYGMAAMSFEKLFVSFLAFHNINAMHHTPMALYKEANKLNPLPENFKETAKLLMKFESICSFDGFGYKTPTDSELHDLIVGLIDIRNFVSDFESQNVIASV
jgi:hypothetical protein